MPALASLRSPWLAGIAATAIAGAVQAQDLPGSADHPALQRFAGSRLTGHLAQDWAEARLPASGKTEPSTGKLVDVLTLEGKVTRLHYLAPKGKTPLEVFRNHQQALMAAGFKPTWVCEQGCGRVYRGWWVHSEPRPWQSGMRWDERGSIPGTGYSHRDAPSEDEGRMWVGTWAGPGGRTLHALVYTSVAGNTQTQMASTFVQLVEPQAMPTGQVTVNAQAIGQGLKAEGRVVLAGLHFDSGKTEVKPDSKPQLDAMEQALKTDPSAKVFIVGHTDNVGALDANLALSQGRAQAVVAALTQRGIAAARLQARGVANLAPVASNASEDGRAKNRRVEMVLQ